MWTSLLLLLTFDARAANLPRGLEGTWELTNVGGRDQAIEALVDDVSFWRRPAVRSRLKQVTAPCAEVQISREGDAIAIRCDDRPDVVDRPDGQPIAWTDAGGHTYDVAIEVRDDAVVQTFTTPDGARTNTYTFGGGSLRIDVEVTSPQLPRPLRYSELYRPPGKEVASGESVIAAEPERAP